MAHGIYSDLPLTRRSVQKAHEIIKPYIHLTPVLTSHSLNDIVSNATDSSSENGPDQTTESTGLQYELYFKCENFQKIGAFKARGAFFNVMTLDEDSARKGVCTHSSGNHAQALALAAKTREIPAHIVMPTISTPSKMAATRGYGAHVHLSGSTSSEREAVLAKVKDDTGATFIPPYDYLGTILGQGTVGLELEQQVGEMTNHEESSKGTLDAVIAPLGGGGLLGGIATALSDPTRHGDKPLVYGAEPSHEGADDGRRGLASDPPKRIEQVKSLTIADGLRTPVGTLNWQIISDPTKVAGVYSVTDEQIKAAMRLLFERLKVFVEPSAAVGLAVVLFDQDFRKECENKAALAGRNNWRIGIVLSGGNTTVEAVSGFFSAGTPDRPTRRSAATEGIYGKAVAENVAG